MADLGPSHPAALLTFKQLNVPFCYSYSALDDYLPLGVPLGAHHLPSVERRLEALRIRLARHTHVRLELGQADAERCDKERGRRGSERGGVARSEYGRRRRGRWVRDDLEREAAECVNCLLKPD